MYLSRESVVGEFHKAFARPTDQEMTTDLLELRYTLLFEEFEEVKEEIAQALSDIAVYGHVKIKTKGRMLKELADLQYVLSGFADTFGLPLQVAFVRVHKSNMSKLDDGGQPILREDGKILKSKNYVPADMEGLVEERFKVPGYEYYETPV
jgi:predicted HAD superfamily Cof-like phosphohydrolase